MQPNTLTRREYKGKIYVKNIRKKSCKTGMYLVIICNLTHLQDGNIKLKFMLRILEKFIPDQDPDTDKKNHSGSTTL
jgi:hypothetical protein